MNSKLGKIVVVHCDSPNFVEHICREKACESCSK